MPDQRPVGLAAQELLPRHEEAPVGQPVDRVTDGRRAVRDDLAVAFLVDSDDLLRAPVREQTRTWASEPPTCRTMARDAPGDCTRRLESDLLAAGEAVVRVPTKLMTRPSGSGSWAMELGLVADVRGDDFWLASVHDRG